MGRIVPLRQPRGERSEGDLHPIVLRLRSQLALIQGYSGLLDSLSPAMQARIFTAIVKTTDELVHLLAPYRTQEILQGRPSIEHYRDTRKRTRALMAEYRLHLAQITEQIVRQRSLSIGFTGTDGTLPHPVGTAEGSKASPTS